MEGQESAATVDPNVVLTIMTTEHYNLQGARSATISEAVGRSSLFLSSISGTLVALGFIGQAAKMGDMFVLFSVVALPSLFFIGLVTYVRVLEISIEDFNYARGINRIRNYYMQRIPEMRQYFVLSGNDDARGVLRNMAVYAPRGQTFVSLTGLIAVLNSVLAGVVTGIVVTLVVAATPVVSGITGGVVFGISVALHQVYAGQKWRDTDKYMTPLFPSQATPRPGASDSPSF